MGKYGDAFRSGADESARRDAKEKEDAETRAIAEREFDEARSRWLQEAAIPAVDEMIRDLDEMGIKLEYEADVLPHNPKGTARGIRIDRASKGAPWHGQHDLTIQVLQTGSVKAYRDGQDYGNLGPMDKADARAVEAILQKFVKDLGGTSSS